MKKLRKLILDQEWSRVPLARNRHPLNVPAVTLASVLLPLLGGCREKITEEPTMTLPSSIEAREKNELVELRGGLFDLQDQLEEVQIGQAILIEALSRQNLPLDREFVEALKSNSGITLQWIETEQRGKLKVSESADGVISMSGKQVGDNGQDTISIEGKVVLNTPTAFVMLGTIEFDVQSLREGGDPLCRREGAFTFRITGDRKYWRLLEKSGHCGRSTDCVDIYL
jgi:hypothetical protein